jgi:hypothetical protein
MSISKFNIFIITLFICASILMIYGCGSQPSSGGSSGGGNYGPSTTEGTIFFLHHSTGSGLINEGGIRASVEAYNLTWGVSFEFWDHGYNSPGLTDKDGNTTGTNYAVPGDNTNPDGLYALWTSGASDWTHTRNEILNHYHEIAFKSCFPASAIPDAPTLQQYKDWYTGIINSCEAYSGHTFVIMSTPPLLPSATNTTEAANARAFADWLTTKCAASGANIKYFNLFNYLASPTTNMLSPEYQTGDSHPNTTANEIVGHAFSEFLLNNY